MTTKQTLKAFDFVRTPKGGIAIVKETVGEGEEASIVFVTENKGKEKSAWWYSNELVVINNLMLLFAENLANPTGSGRNDARKFFGNTH